MDKEVEMEVQGLKYMFSNSADDIAAEGVVPKLWGVSTEACAQLGRSAIRRRI